MKTSTISSFGGICAALVLFFLALAVVSADITFSTDTKKDSYELHGLLSATTTSATSTNITGGGGYAVIAGAKKATFYFSRGGSTGANTGSSKFEVEVSRDNGLTWNDFNRLYLVDSSKTATSTVWITAATSTVVASMDLEMNGFNAVRCQVVEVTDGDHTCAVGVTF